MSANERLLEVRRWLRYAREDLTVAETLLNQDDLIPRHACWLAQQSAEKALKAVWFIFRSTSRDDMTSTRCAI